MALMALWGPFVFLEEGIYDFFLLEIAKSSALSWDKFFEDNPAAKGAGKRG